MVDFRSGTEFKKQNLNDLVLEGKNVSEHHEDMWKGSKIEGTNWISWYDIFSIIYMHIDKYINIFIYLYVFIDKREKGGNARFHIEEC